MLCPSLRWLGALWLRFHVVDIDSDTPCTARYTMTNWFFNVHSASDCDSDDDDNDDDDDGNGGRRCSI